jgi:hypothetical protein
VKVTGLVSGNSISRQFNHSADRRTRHLPLPQLKIKIVYWPMALFVAFTITLVVFHWPI